MRHVPWLRMCASRGAACSVVWVNPWAVSPSRLFPALFCSRPAAGLLSVALAAPAPHPRAGRQDGDAAGRRGAEQEPRPERKGGCRPPAHLWAQPAVAAQAAPPLAPVPAQGTSGGESATATAAPAGRLGRQGRLGAPLPLSGQEAHPLAAWTQPSAQRALPRFPASPRSLPSPRLCCQFTDKFMILLLVAGVLAHIAYGYISTLPMHCSTAGC